MASNGQLNETYFHSFSFKLDRDAASAYIEHALLSDQILKRQSVNDFYPNKFCSYRPIGFAEIYCLLSQNLFATNQFRSQLQTFFFGCPIAACLVTRKKHCLN